MCGNHQLQHFLCHRQLQVMMITGEFQAADPIHHFQQLRLPSNLLLSTVELIGEAALITISYGRSRSKASSDDIVLQEALAMGAGRRFPLWRCANHRVRRKPSLGREGWKATYESSGRSACAREMEGAGSAESQIGHHHGLVLPRRCHRADNTPQRCG